MVGKGKVHNQIKQLRKAAGHTQAGLADAVGATRQTIIAIEAGKYSPSLELAFRIAREFDVPFEDVFQFQPEKELQKGRG
ncbi:MAG: helix-turn-helix transcriptional regulator [Pseudomonadota bacterium]